jgi:PAS domain-containing protein
MTQDMLKPRPRLAPLTRYALAVGLVLAGLTIRRSLSGWLGQSAPLFPMPFVVFLAAYLGGIGPGLLATVLAALITAFLFFEPIGTLHITKATDQFIMMTFLALGVLISVQIERTRRLYEKTLAAELALSESRYLNLIYQSPDPILVVCGGVIQVINTPMVELLGPIRRQGLLAQPLLDFVFPGDKELLSQWLTEARGKLHRTPAPIRFVRLDGQVIEATINADVSQGQGEKKTQLTLLNVRSVLIPEMPSGEPAASVGQAAVV